MKTLLKSIIAFMLLISVSSCKKDEDAKDFIVKKWKLEKVVYKNYFTGDMATYTETNNTYLDFAADKHFVSNIHTSMEGDVPYNVTFTSSDNASGTWSLSSDNTVISFDFDVTGVASFTVEKLTDSEFIFWYDKTGDNEQTFYFKK
ncbi:MAG: lipocalin family protein [Sphingobacteriales bacterium JAD_PAG50586_3]|nr:MAG: lipocalin family protein [Sphingobacteriales bacterium JAD_PAG50586_3]